MITLVLRITVPLTLFVLTCSSTFDGVEGFDTSAVLISGAIAVVLAVFWEAIWKATWVIAKVILNVLLFLDIFGALGD